MIVELVSVAVIFTGGCLTVRAAGLAGWPVAALGLVAGVCVHLAAGLVQVVTPLPTGPALTLALTGGLPAAWWAARWWQGHDVAIPVRYAAVCLLALVPLVAVFRIANLVKWHTDSFRYLMTGSLLADGTYYTAVSTHNVTKRLIGLPVLHAPAHLAGEDYLRSITPLLAIATVGVLVWFVRQGVPERLDRTQVVVLAGLGALLLVSGNRFVFSAVYLNGHLLMAALLLVVAGCGWLLLRDRDPDRSPRTPLAPLMLLQLIAIPALVVTRPEGPVVAGLALLPTVLSGRVPLRHRSAVVLVLGLTAGAWQGFMLWVHLQRGADVPLTVSGPLVLGVVLALGAGLLRWAPRRPEPARLLLLGEAGLWLALAALAGYRPRILADSVHATVENVILGAGRWGTSLVVLAVLVVGAIVLGGDRALAALRFPVTTFVPVGLILAYLREEGAYRVGYGDSFSRMFMHVVPLAILYVVVAFSDADRSTRWNRLLSTTSQRGADSGAAKETTGDHD